MSYKPRKMINEAISACKFVLVNPATSASSEISFSTSRRLKTWQFATMTQQRFSNLTILNSHKGKTDGLSLVDVANEFTDRNDTEQKEEFS